jgi:hypothetical protein
MIPGLVAQLDRLGICENAVAALREPVGRIIGQTMPAGLRFQHQGKSGIAADIDPLDRVHLDGNIEGHEPDLLIRSFSANLWLINACHAAFP